MMRDKIRSGGTKEQEKGRELAHLSSVVHHDRDLVRFRSRREIEPVFELTSPSTGVPFPVRERRPEANREEEVSFEERRRGGGGISSSPYVRIRMSSTTLEEISIESKNGSFLSDPFDRGSHPGGEGAEEEGGRAEEGRTEEEGKLKGQLWTSLGFRDGFQD